jgi:Protein of unknown function (DUF1064)
VYHSKGEATYARDLDILLKAGHLTEIVPQYKIDLSVNGKHITNYIIDFKVTHADGEVEYIEYKGFATDTWKLKWKLLEAIHPDWKLTLVMH